MVVSEAPLITLFPKAAAKPEELPDDPHLANLAFLARHLDDLQTIRFAGIPVALMELPLLDSASHHAQLITLAITVALSVAWYYLSRYWFRNHYGRSWNDASMMEYSGGWTPRTVVAFTVFGVLFCWFELLAVAPAKHHLVNMWWIMGMSAWSGKIVRDRTNLSIRRTVYKFSALAYIFCVLPILLTAFAAYAHGATLQPLAFRHSSLRHCTLRCRPAASDLCTDQGPRKGNRMKSDSLDIGSIVGDLNRTVHEPARLAILTVLSACDSADFVFLKAATDLTAGNLSVQITRLEQAGLVTVEKIMERRRTITTISLSHTGRGELKTYWSAMARMSQMVKQGERTTHSTPHKLPAKVRPQTT